MMCILHTSSQMLSSAFACSKSSATAACPKKAANMSAVQPFYAKDRGIPVHIVTHQILDYPHTQ